jgi:hypothetical protein
LVDGEDDSDENNKDRWAALLIDADNRVICRRISIAGSRPASGREGPMAMSERWLMATHTVLAVAVMDWIYLSKKVVRIASYNDFIMVSFHLLSI